MIFGVPLSTVAQLAVTVEAIAAVLAAFATVAALVFVAIQMRDTRLELERSRRTSNAELSLCLFDLWQSPALTQARARERQWHLTSYDDFRSQVRDSDEDREAWNALQDFFEMLGLVVCSEAIDTEMAESYFEAYVKLYWERYSSIISQMREDPRYQDDLGKELAQELGKNFERMYEMFELPSS